MTQAIQDPPARTCDGCTLCCKVMAVETLNKPDNVMCRHCEPGKGCGIYDARPELCRTFMCGYLLEPRLGPEWKPSVSGIVLITDRLRMIASVDKETPDAWRREPYYSTFRNWARAGAQHGASVHVIIGSRVIQIMSNGEVER